MSRWLTGLLVTTFSLELLFGADTGVGGMPTAAEETPTDAPLRIDEARRPLITRTLWGYHKLGDVRLSKRTDTPPWWEGERTREPRIRGGAPSRRSRRPEPP